MRKNGLMLQTCIKGPVKLIWWSFFERVNYFCKKPSIREPWQAPKYVFVLEFSFYFFLIFPFKFDYYEYSSTAYKKVLLWCLFKISRWKRSTITLCLAYFKYVTNSIRLKLPHKSIATHDYPLRENNFSRHHLC